MSEPFSTSDILVRAKEWLETAAPRWRLQTLQTRSRYNPETGKYKQLPTRIRRFLNGTPSGMKAAVLSVLKESSPYKSPVYDLECDGNRYRPVNTFIRKDGQEHTTNAADATYTIIQDLRLDDGTLDRYDAIESNSCSETSSSEYRWDEVDVEDCPDASQGIVYQITGISRDQETDLFSYSIRKVQSLTQHTGPTVVQCTRLNRVTVESWNNVYGEPGSFMQDPLTGGSAPVEVPDACASGQGTSIQVNFSKNPDCTYRIEITKTEAKTLDSQFSIYKDQYKVSESTRTMNALGSLSKNGVVASGGVITKYSSERNPDGTWTNSVDKETEKPVSLSTKEVRVTPRSTIVSTVNTNFPSAVTSLAAGKFGSYRYTKTPGKLYTNETVEYNPKVVPLLGYSCTDNAFLKTHETQGTASSLKEEHVPAASLGVVTTYSFDTDGEGNISKRVKTDTEHTVENASRQMTRSVIGTTVGFAHKSVSKAVMESLMSEVPIGKTVSAKLTPGNLWDVDVQTFSGVAGQVMSTSCSKTIFQHMDEVQSTVSSMGACTEEAGGGITRTVRFNTDPSTGSITRSTSTTYEKTVSESAKSIRVTPNGTVSRVSDSNVDSVPNAPIAVGSTLEVQKTPGGKFNVTLETITPSYGTVQTTCQRDAFSHTHSDTAIVRSPSSTEAEAASAGTFKDINYRLTEFGWEETKTDHKEENRTWVGREYEDAFGKTKVTEETSVSKMAGNKGVKYEKEKLVRSIESSMTKGANYQVRTTEEVPTPYDTGWIHFEKPNVLSNATAIETVVYDTIIFRNQDIDWVKDKIDRVKRLNYVINGGGSWSNSPSININPNKFGLFDGSISMSSRFTPKAWASGGSTPDDNIEYKYTVKDSQVSVLNTSGSVNGIYLLVQETTETHLRGGGVGAEKFKELFSGKNLVRGSQASFSPSGQSFQFDLITERVITHKVVRADEPITIGGQVNPK